MSSNLPLGVFDSGIGGLSVLRDIRALLPNEDVRYYADSAYCPYGLRSREEIQERSRLICGELFDQGAKGIVVACNTASAMAIEDMRASFPGRIIVGLEPAVKPAVGMTRSGKVGVLATPRTVAGERLLWLIETFAGGVEVRTVAGVGLVELVEAGTLEGDAVRETLQPLLDPMIAAGVDVIVLGCTHYPFLRAEIEAYMGPSVPVIDSGVAIARRTQHVLGQAGLLADQDRPGDVELMTSGPVDEVAPIAAQLLGEPVPVTSRQVGATIGSPR
jgi:glutamate racemase